MGTKRFAPLPALPIVVSAHACRRASKRIGLRGEAALLQAIVGASGNVERKDRSWLVSIAGDKATGKAVLVEQNGSLLVATVLNLREGQRRR